MDAFTETIALARKELNADERNNARSSEYSYGTQDTSRQKRRLLDIAWKMYDITSEMYYLKSDVVSLAGKIDSLEASAEKDDDTIGKGVGMKSKEDHFPNRDNAFLDIKELLNQKKRQNQIKSEGRSMLGMDDLSFSIFKQIVSEIAAECVGKFVAADSELGNQRLTSLEEIRKSRPKKPEKESERYARENKDERLDYWKDGSEREKYFKGSAEDKRSTWRYSSERGGNKKERDLMKYSPSDLKDHYEEELERKPSDVLTKKQGSVTTKKQVSFRKQNSSIEDWSAPEDTFFSKLNDSLYFHRSHLSPVQNSRRKPKDTRRSGRISPEFSSDGSDFL